MRHALIISVSVLALSSAPGIAAAQEPASMAVFDFGFVDTSPQPPTPEEMARVVRLNAQLRAEMAKRVRVLEVGPAQAGAIPTESIQGCNGCEYDIARAMGAQQLAYGWVQKVSDLILNINLVVEDVDSGRRLRADSVDIRGNTDESWSRGLRYLIDERLYREP